ALRRLDGAVHLALRHAVALRHELEMVDQRFHVALHLFAARRPYLAVIDHGGARIRLQPCDALVDYARRLAQFFDANQVAIVAIAVDADGNVEIHAIVYLIGLLLAQVPLDPGAAQHGPGEPQLHRAFGTHHADVHGALLPDAVVREQG